MLLAVDVGNTQTHVGLFDEKQLIASWRFATVVNKTGDEIASLLDSLLRLDGFSRSSVSAIAVASVVPRLSGEYSVMAADKFGIEALVVGPGVKNGMPILTQTRFSGARPQCRRGAPSSSTALPVSRSISERRLRYSAVSAPASILDMPSLRYRDIVGCPGCPGCTPDESGVGGSRYCHRARHGAGYTGGGRLRLRGQVDGIVGRMRNELGSKAVTVATGASRL